MDSLNLFGWCKIEQRTRVGRPVYASGVFDMDTISKADGLKAILGRPRVHKSRPWRSWAMRWLDEPSGATSRCGRTHRCV